MNDLFLRACWRQSVERTPVWLMRQAGRALPEYRKVRRRVDFTTLYRTPELAAEVSLQPLDRLGVDAVILFSDILVPAEPMGFRVKFEPGPVLDAPVRSASDVDRILTPDPEETAPYVYETIRLLRRELTDRVPLIGFAAAPFTLAVYLVEGRGSKDFRQIKRLVYGDPAMAHLLLEKVTVMTEKYVVAQARAGAQAIQLFDTWAGLLGRKDFREFALRYAKRVFEGLQGQGVPRVYFALDSSHLLQDIRECGADVVGVDWRVDLAQASHELDHNFALQGNLDPCVLATTPHLVEQRAREILRQGRDLPGHIFNLGHGVLPSTPLKNLHTLVRTVQADRRP
jgi:uroporphyrinogen decarboxylase